MVTWVISAWIACIKAFNCLLLKARCCWLTERQRQLGMGWPMELPLPELSLLCLESSYPLSIHSWGSTIYNRYLSHYLSPFALTITFSSAALEDADDRWTALAAAQWCKAINQLWSAHQLPQATPPESSFSLSFGKGIERKSIKMWAIPPDLLSICNVTMQGWPFAGQEAIPEAILRKQPFPWLGCDIAVLFHISRGRETLNKMQGWILLHTSGILQFGENLTFTEKNKNRILGFRTITKNKSHHPLFQTS